MANEIRIASSLQIAKGNLKYNSALSGFQANLNGSAGPTPGCIFVGQRHTEPSLAQLRSLGGWAEIIFPGLDQFGNTIQADAYIEIGVYDPIDNDFIPIHELLSGEMYHCRLSRFLGTELIPGTGTTQFSGSPLLSFKLNSDTDPMASTVLASVILNAFDK